MEKKKIVVNTKIVAIALVALMISIIAPISYAFFTASVTGNDSAKTTVVEAGTLRLELSDGQVIGTTTNWVPGASITKSFTVENIGSLTGHYSIYLRDIINEFVDKSDLVYEIVGLSSGTSSAYSTTTAVEAPSDDKKIIDNIAINAGETHSYTLTLRFLNKNENQDDNQNKAFSAKVQLYDAADEPEIASVSFATSSWNAIISAYNNGNTSQLQTDMENGVTRDIDLGNLGVHQLRIANLTKCSEVSVTSKTSCGLIIEFADIITTHRMNSNSTNDGGWQSSEMRTYVNNDIYNLIPSELRYFIIDTAVVSGHGPNDNTNFTTTDKLYLLSSREVWDYINGYDTASGDGVTRQLDYYESIGVTIDNCSGAIKKNGSSEAYWWLRSANSSMDISFFTVINDGRWSNNGAVNTNGVSPAFRLAN